VSERKGRTVLIHVSGSSDVRVIAAALRMAANNLEVATQLPAEPDIALSVTTYLSDEPLTPPQTKLLTYLRTYFRTYGRSASLRECCVAMGFTSTNSVTDLLKRLQKKGYLEFTPTISRSIHLLG